MGIGYSWADKYGQQERERLLANYPYGGMGAPKRPRFGTYETLTPAQKKIMTGLMRKPSQKEARYKPVKFGELDTYREFDPVSVGPNVPVGAADMPTAGRPTYGAMSLAGAGERGAMLSRMMGVSPTEEAAAIEAMSAPAMRQFREEILPQTRGKYLGEGTAWSTMRAGAEAKAGGGLAERLAAMGEQHRMQRRGQAMEAGGLSMQEALGSAQAGLTRYGTEMQPYMQAQGMLGQEAMQRQALGVQAGMQGQQLGLQAGLQAQELTARSGQAGELANLQAQIEAALQAQRLTAGGQQSREQLLAQLLGIPMMGVYSY